MAVCSFQKAWHDVTQFCDMKTSSQTHVEVRKITVKSEKAAFNPPRTPFQKTVKEAEVAMVMGGLLGGIGQGLGSLGAAKMNRHNMQWLAEFNAQKAQAMMAQNFEYSKALNKQKFDQNLQLHTLRAEDRLAAGNKAKDEGPKTADAATAMMGVGSTQTDGNITGMNTKRNAFFRDHGPTMGQFGSIQPFTRGTQADLGEEGVDVGVGSQRLFKRRNVGTNFGLGVPGPSRQDASTGMGYAYGSVGTQTGPATRGRANQAEGILSASEGSSGGNSSPVLNAATVSTSTSSHQDAAAAAGPAPQAHVPHTPEEAGHVPSTPAEAAHGAPPAQHNIT